MISFWWLIWVFLILCMHVFQPNIYLIFPFIYRYGSWILCLMQLFLLLMPVRRHMIAVVSSIHHACRKQFCLILKKMITVMSLIRWVKAGLSWTLKINGSNLSVYCIRVTWCFLLPGDAMQTNSIIIFICSPFLRADIKVRATKLFLYSTIKKFVPSI